MSRSLWEDFQLRITPSCAVTSEVGSSYPLTDIPETTRPGSPTGTTHLCLFLSLPTCGQNKELLLILWSPYCKHDKGWEVQGRGLWLIVGAALNRLISFGEDPGILRQGSLVVRVIAKSRGKGAVVDSVSLYPLTSGEKTLGGRPGS